MFLFLSVWPFFLSLPPSLRLSLPDGGSVCRLIAAQSRAPRCSYRENFHAILNVPLFFLSQHHLSSIVSEPPFGKYSGPLHISVGLTGSLSLAQGYLAHLQEIYIYISKAGVYLGKYSKLYTELFHYCCLQGFECEHGSKILIAYCTMFETTAHSFSPWCLPSLVSSLSSVIPPVLPKDSQEAGNRSGVITGKERKGGRKDGQGDGECEGRAVCVIIAQ